MIELIVINIVAVNEYLNSIYSFGYLSNLHEHKKLHKGTKLHEGTKMHKDTFAQADYFAQVDVFFSTNTVTPNPQSGFFFSLLLLTLTLGQ